MPHSRHDDHDDDNTNGDDAIGGAGGSIQPSVEQSLKEYFTKGAGFHPLYS